MNNRTFYITEEQQRRLLNESAADRFIDKLILKNLPENAKGMINTPLNVIAKEHPEALNGVALNDSPEVMEKYGNLPLKDFIRVSIMQMFDISHGKGPKKYLRGIFRIMLDEIRCLSNPDMNRINLLKDDVMYIMQASQNGSDPEASQMDGDLNGMSLTQINQTFKEKRKAFFANIRNKLSSTFKGKSNASRYEKVVITNHDQCVKYAPYVGWCITFNSSANYDAYTQGGRRFYLFLKEGYQNIECKTGENCPFDEYGMSMVSVLVDMVGNISIITTRWNHEHDGELNNPSQEQIEMVMNLMGVNLYRECPPYTRDELRAMGITPFEDVPELLAQGVDPNDIFSQIDDFDEGFAEVELNGKYNYLTTDRMLLSPDQWFDWVGTFYDGFARVELNNSKYNFITTDGRLLSPDQWFDAVSYFFEGFAEVELNGKYNYLTTEGRIFYKPNEPDQWFNAAGRFSEGFARVELNNGKWNYLTTDGRIFYKPNEPDQWFNWGGDFCWVGNFSEVLAKVQLNNGKYNFLTSHGQIFYKPNDPDQWFGAVDDFFNGFALVELNGKYYYLRNDGVLCDYDTKQPIGEMNESRTNKHTFYITETRLNEFSENMLTESFIIPKHEQVRVVREYLDKNFLRSESDDIDENGYPCKVKSVTLVSSNGQALKPMTIAELFMMLDDKFNRIIRDKDKRQAFLKQVITDWYYKRISKEGILSANVIQVGEKKKK